MVAGIVAVGVVEPFEMIDVHHRDRELATQARQRFVERPPPGELGQAIAIRHHVGGLDHRDDQDQARGGKPDFLTGPGRRPRECRKHGR